MLYFSIVLNLDGRNIGKFFISGHLFMAFLLNWISIHPVGKGFHANFLSLKFYNLTDYKYILTFTDSNTNKPLPKGQKGYGKREISSVGFISGFQSKLQICFAYFFMCFQQRLINKKYIHTEMINQDFFCLICADLPVEAVETLCCGQLMCHKCADDVSAKFNACPNCRQSLVYKPSIISRRMISTMKVDCKHECGIQINNKDKKEHEMFCQKRILTCKGCKKPCQISQLVLHMQESHPQELIKLCVGFHQSDIEPVSSLKKTSSVGSSEKNSSTEILNKMKNSNNDWAQFGTTGKFYCGKNNLVGKCGCCNGHCGPTNGQNCDACMELDARRFNLNKGFLINAVGVICKFDDKNKVYYCGRRCEGGFRAPTKFCDVKDPCHSCKRTTASVVQLGRYKNLI